jgi:hypothetical protein
LSVLRPPKWNHWAEVVFGDERLPQYLGDMPHTWIGAEYILAFRNLFVYEKGDQLILGAGIPRSWVKDRKGIRIRDVPTYFGKISYSMRRTSEGLKVKVFGNAKPPKGFIFKSPTSKTEFYFFVLPKEISISEK